VAHILWLAGYMANEHLFMTFRYNSKRGHFRERTKQFILKQMLFRKIFKMPFSAYSANFYARSAMSAVSVRKENFKYGHLSPLFTVDLARLYGVIGLIHRCRSILTISQTHVFEVKLTRMAYYANGELHLHAFLYF